MTETVGYRWKLVVEYDGTEFVGWSRQPGQRTIQGCIEETLTQLFQHPIQVAGSGRTDAGVHALGQVAGFTAPKKRDPESIRLGLNGLLPHDISVVSVQRVGLDFEPRFWSRSKRYRYTWLVRSTRSPLQRRQVWHVFRPLDVEMMQLAGQHLVGKHDFSSFRAQGCQGKHAVRRIEALSVTTTGDNVHLDVHGHGFLRHMVRIVAGTLYEVGIGRQPSSWVTDVLQAKDRTRSGRTAPARGLCLMEVVYGEGPPDWFIPGG
jgi:tRNA pseudouridine38-40 synthase